MDPRPAWSTTVLALGFLALVGLMFWRATEKVEHFDQLWAAVGPVLGVVVGAIPGYFFANRSRDGERNAQARAELYASQLDPDKLQGIEPQVRALR